MKTVFVLESSVDSGLNRHWCLAARFVGTEIYGSWISYV